LKSGSRLTQPVCRVGKGDINVSADSSPFEVLQMNVFMAVFLFQLLLLIAFLLSEVLLQTTFLAIPYRFVLLRALPEIYGEKEKLAAMKLHPYFASGLLFVSVTTLVLFFASGMYSEKIAYANQCVVIIFFSSMSLMILGMCLTQTER
jgi:Spo7-like protein